MTGQMRRWMPTGIATIALMVAIGSRAADRDAARTAFSQDEPIKAIEGLLSKQPAAALGHVRQQCLTLPGDAAEVLAPHGDSLLSTRCEVVAYEPLGLRRWSAARYAWTLVFTAEDKTRGADARDTATQEEVVLFEAVPGGSVRPIWHMRFDTTDYAVWRSITPEVARAEGGTTLLSIMSCVNGTGGCAQDFLHRHADGRWSPVTQAWLKQLPPGFAGRIRHGVRIEPRTLHGEAGFYGDGDPNCCPSQVLEVDLLLRGDALVLRRSARVRKTKQ